MLILQTGKVGLQPRLSGPLQTALGARVCLLTNSTRGQAPHKSCEEEEMQPCLGHAEEQQPGYLPPRRKEGP